MVTLVNRAKVSTATTGTGTITLGSAESGYQTFADAGVTDAQVVRYVIEDGTDWEIGTGTYTATGTTLSRTVSESSNADAALNLSGSAVVYVSATAADLAPVLELYAENPSSPTAPSATGTNAVAIGSGAVAATNQSIALGLNATVGTSIRGTALGFSASATGNQATAISDSVASGGNSFAAVADAVASATDSIAIGRAATASSAYATAIGKNSSDQGSVATSGTAAMALGGSYASGADSFAAAIANNTNSYGAQGPSSIAMGYQAKTNSGADYALAIGHSAQSTGDYCVAIGYSTSAAQVASLALGYDSTGNGSYGVAIGYQANCAAEKSVALGDNTQTSATNSFAFGKQSKTQVLGKYAYASGQFAAAGDAQGGQFVLRADTTDATATVLTTNNSAAGSDDQIVAASDTCITFDGTITAMQNGAQAYASWRIEGLLVNDGGTTTLANSATTVIQNLSSWGMALTADNTNNALAITCTGEASHNIRWVANIRTTEVTYA
jgi:hypothetical protein